MPYALQLYQHTRGSEAVHPSHSSSGRYVSITTPLRLRLSVQPAIQKIISHQPPHSFLARKGFSRRFAAKLSHKQPGSRIVGLVIIIIIIHPNRRSTPTPTSPPCRLFGQPTLLSLNTKIGPQHATTVQVQKLGGRISPYSCSACIPCPCPCPLCLIELRKMRQSSASRRSGCAVGRRAVRDALANPLLCWHSVPTLTVVCQGMLLYYDLCQGAPFLLSSHPTSPDT